MNPVIEKYRYTAFCADKAGRLLQNPTMIHDEFVSVQQANPHRFRRELRYIPTSAMSVRTQVP